MKRIQLTLPAIAMFSLLTLSLARSNEPSITKSDSVENRVVRICRQHDGPDLKIHELIVSVQDLSIFGEAKNRQLAKALTVEIQEAFGNDSRWLNEPYRMDPDDGSVTFRIANYPKANGPVQGALGDFLKTKMGQGTWVTVRSVSRNSAHFKGRARTKEKVDDLLKGIKEQLGPKYHWHDAVSEENKDGGINFALQTYFVDNTDEEALKDQKNLARHRVAKVHQALARTNLHHKKQAVRIREIESTTDRLLLKFQGVSRHAANRFLNAIAEGLPAQEVTNPPLKMDRSGAVAGQLKIRAKAAALPATQTR